MLHRRTYWQRVDLIQSLSSSQQTAVIYEYDIWRKRPFTSRLLVGGTVQEDGCLPATPLRVQTSDRLQSVCSTTGVCLQCTRALFNRSYDVQCHVVSSTAGYCRIGSAIFDIDRYLESAPTTLISWAKFTRTCRAPRRPGRTLENGQPRYKLYFENSARMIPTLLPGQFIFVVSPLEQLIPTVPFLHKLLLELLSKTVGLVQTTLTLPGTVTLKEDGVQNTKSIDCDTRTPNKFNATEKTEATYIPKKAWISPTKHLRDGRADNAEYPDEKIITQIEPGHNILYDVHWYGTPATARYRGASSPHPTTLFPGTRVAKFVDSNL